MKLISKTLCRASLVLTMLVMALSVSAQINAADPVQCKGLENAACVSQESCSWVKGYERKDGKSVNAFCRTKAKQKTTSATPTVNSNKTS